MSDRDHALYVIDDHRDSSSHHDNNDNDDNDNNHHSINNNIDDEKGYRGELPRLTSSNNNNNKNNKNNNNNNNNNSNNNNNNDDDNHNPFTSAPGDRVFNHRSSFSTVPLPSRRPPSSSSSSNNNNNNNDPSLGPSRYVNRDYLIDEIENHSMTLYKVYWIRHLISYFFLGLSLSNIVLFSQNPPIDWHYHYYNSYWHYGEQIGGIKCIISQIYLIIIGIIMMIWFISIQLFSYLHEQNYLPSSLSLSSILLSIIRPSNELLLSNHSSVSPSSSFPDYRPIFDPRLSFSNIIYNISLFPTSPRFGIYLFLIYFSTYLTVLITSIISLIEMATKGCRGSDAHTFIVDFNSIFIFFITFLLLFIIIIIKYQLSSTNYYRLSILPASHILVFIIALLSFF